MLIVSRVRCECTGPSVPSERQQCVAVVYLMLSESEAC